MEADRGRVPRMQLTGEANATVVFAWRSGQPQQPRCELHHSRLRHVVDRPRKRVEHEFEVSIDIDPPVHERFAWIEVERRGERGAQAVRRIDAAAASLATVAIR